jgi:hypothetical protein
VVVDSGATVSGRAAAASLSSFPHKPIALAMQHRKSSSVAR